MKNFLNNKLNSISITTVILIFIFVTSLVPIICLAVYSRPCVDDYSYSISTHKLVEEGKANPISLVKEAIIVDINFYNSWQGLYTSAFKIGYRTESDGQPLLRHMPDPSFYNELPLSFL